MIQIGDKVKTGVYVANKWIPMNTGIVVEQNFDRSLSKVDIMSLHGGAPWICAERTDHLRKVKKMHNHPLEPTEDAGSFTYKHEKGIVTAP